MREILFKGKRIDNGEWVEGFYAIKGKGTDLEQHVICVSELDNYSSIDRFYLVDIEVNPKTVSQATGLKDKNGKMIFEGDKLKIKTFVSQEFEKDKFIEFDDKFIVWSCEQLQYVLLNKKEIEQIKKGSNHFKYSGHGDFDNVYYLCDLESYEIEIIGNIHDKG